MCVWEDGRVVLGDVSVGGGGGGELVKSAVQVRTRLALETLDQTSLLTADVSPAAAVKVHIEIDACAACVLTDHAGVVGLLDGCLQYDGLT